MCAPKICSPNGKLIFRFIFGPAGSGSERLETSKKILVATLLLWSHKGDLGGEKRLDFTLLCKALPSGTDSQRGSAAELFTQERAWKSGG